MTMSAYDLIKTHPTENFDEPVNVTVSVGSVAPLAKVSVIVCKP